MSNEAKCPFHHAAGGGTSNQDWLPNQLKLELLHQHSSKSNPMGEDFNYAEEFKGFLLFGTPVQASLTVLPQTAA